jgi:hypothetical protein
MFVRHLLRSLSIGILIVGGFGLKTAQAQLLTASTSSWVPLKYGGSSTYDPSVDQQTGQRESDLVGTANLIPSFYTTFDPGTSSLTDGTIYFRSRHSEDSQSAGYSGYLWVGIDANADNILDIFVGAARQGTSSSFRMVICNPGTNTNSSPNTTTITTEIYSASHTASNYDWSPVSASNYSGTNFDADSNGNTDYFMSFSLPFQEIVNALNTTGNGRPTAISINENTALRYVVATSQQGNSINQDYNGGSIGVNSSTSWVSLGVISDPTSTISMSTIPEPSSFFFLILGVGAIAKRLGAIARRNRV